MVAETVRASALCKGVCNSQLSSTGLQTDCCCHDIIVWCAATGPGAKRQQVSLVDALLGPSQPPEAPQPQQDAAAAAPAAARASAGGVMSRSSGGGGGGGSSSGGNVAAPQRPLPALKLKDRLKAIRAGGGGPPQT